MLPVALRARLWYDKGKDGDHDMDRSGVFISYAHQDWMLAGRVYDMMSARGFQPFLDNESMHQGDFPQELERRVRETPYFLLLLTKRTRAALQTGSRESWIVREVETAQDSGRTIFVLGEKGMTFPEPMPEHLLPISRKHIYEFDRINFRQVMERLCNEDISMDVMRSHLNWRGLLRVQSNTCLASREQMERSFATLESRFGRERVQCISEGRPYTGPNRIAHINMSCYAANVIFTHGRDMVDAKAYDHGMMFNLFSSLLEDEDFSMEIVITAPGGAAVQDAIRNGKLGNRALEAYPEATFLASYFGITRLVRENEVFRRAKESGRFRFMVTENVLPYALFQMEYKPGYEQYSHFKVDLYSEGLISNMERRCMMVFQQDDRENYDFFVERYKYIRDVGESRRLIRANHAQWEQEWAELQEEMKG